MTTAVPTQRPAESSSVKERNRTGLFQTSLEGAHPEGHPPFWQGVREDCHLLAKQEWEFAEAPVG